MRYNFNKVALIIILLVVSLTSLGIIVGVGLHSTTPTARLSRLQAIEDPPLNITPAPNCLVAGVVTRLTPTPTPTVTPTPPLTTQTPTSTPTSTPRQTVTPTPTGLVGRTISGRFYLETSLPNVDNPVVGRNSFGTHIPPIAGKVPVQIDLVLKGGATNSFPLAMDIANHANKIDICSESSKDEYAPIDNRYCGLDDPAGIKHPHCSTYGGFSFTIPPEAQVFNVNGVNYYNIIVRANVENGSSPDGNNNLWVITEAYWMNTDSTATPPLGKGFPYNFGEDYPPYGKYGDRCDCRTITDVSCQRSPVRCNRCIGGAQEANWANMCHGSSQACSGNIYGYVRGPLTNVANISIPVDDLTRTRYNLWIGLAKKQ